MENNTEQREELLSLTADIVASFVSNNTMAVADVPGLIGEIYQSLAGLAANGGQAEVELEPAVPIKKSIRPDYIVCLEDGKKLKMLKRHLKTQYNLSPEEYRERWNLPSDYPMVAPNYAKQRRELAQKIGLGRGRRKKKSK